LDIFLKTALSAWSLGSSASLGQNASFEPRGESPKVVTAWKWSQRWHLALPKNNSEIHYKNWQWL